jgi:hypothetical protein
MNRGIRRYEGFDFGKSAIPIEIMPLGAFMVIFAIIVDTMEVAKIPLRDESTRA